MLTLRALSDDVLGNLYELASIHRPGRRACGRPTSHSSSRSGCNLFRGEGFYMQFVDFRAVVIVIVAALGVVATFVLDAFRTS